MNSIRCSLLLCFILILTYPLSALDESGSIINISSLKFQIIPLRNLENWPGVEQSALIDLSLLGGRITLVWPDVIISLPPDGKPDEKTLLTLFATTYPESQWQMENGTVATDGYWIAPDAEGRLGRFNLQNAEFYTYSAKISYGPLYPIPGAAILSFTPKAVRIAPDGSRGTLPVSRPLSTLFAVSPLDDRMAWLERETLRISSYLNRRQIQTISLAGKVPTLGIRALSWVGDLLALAMPGTIALIDPDSANWQLQQHPLIPRYWYYLRGTSTRIALASPESANVILIEKTKPGHASEPEHIDYEFSALLKDYALQVGEILQLEAGTERSAAYYSWVLPMIRDFRSRYPLDFRWAEMEALLVERRAQL